MPKPPSKRGRTSVADLMVPENPLEIVQRPDAPYELTDEAADEWRGIVRSMPADHFTKGNFPMLAQLCRHIIAARRIDQLIEKCLKEKPFVQRQYTALLQYQATESLSIMRLSRSMRLTQQSTKANYEAKPLKGGKDQLPWESDDSDDE
jgi:hypothetical protein